MNNKKRVNTIGNSIHYLGFGYCKDYFKSYKKNPPAGGKKDKEIISVSGAAMLISKEFFQNVGGFDEGFFMYGEDQDLSWRGSLKGYKHFLSSRAIIYHDYDFSRHKNKMFYSERNRLITIIKNYSLKTLILLSPIIMLNELFVLFYFLFNGWILLKLRSYISVIKQIKDVIKTRKDIQAARAIKDKIILKKFESELDFILFNNKIIQSFINPLYSFYKKILMIIL